MKCYFCTAENIQGIELCVQCGADLAGLDIPEAKSGFRGRLVTDAVRDLDLSQPILADVDDTADLAITKMRSQSHGCVLVTDKGRLAGIFTEKDVLRRIVRAGIDPKEARLKSVMTKAPVTVHPSDPPAHVVHAIVSGGFRHVPVVQGEDVLGFLSVRNLLRYVHQDVMGRTVH